MEKEITTGTIGTAVSLLGTAMQTNEILQTISLIISIIGGVITFIVVPLWTWYHNAKADGKITKDEIEDGIDIAKTGVEKVSEDINKKKGE